MHRTYSARVIALIVGSTPKWVDNLLSHHDLPGVVRGRQGIERRIGDHGLLAIEVVRILTADLGIPTVMAAGIARALLDAGASAELRFETRSGATLVFNVAKIERRLRDRALEAVEAVPRRARGRPRGAQ